MIRNNIGFGRIDSLLKDGKIEDISCSGPNIPVYLYHKEYENIRTNIVFEEEELNSFIFLLAQRSGKNISVAKLILMPLFPMALACRKHLGERLLLTEVRLR